LSHLRLLSDLTPARLRRLLNVYPPYLGAGVRITHIAEDWSRVDVQMKLRWYNRNALGTHFGGSLYSMVDPHLMLMLMQCLGVNYQVWDKWAAIDFQAPGRGTVRATLEITQETLADIRQHTQGGEKCLPEFEIPIIDNQGQPIALVQKRIYVRRKCSAPFSPSRTADSALSAVRKREIQILSLKDRIHLLNSDNPASR